MEKILIFNLEGLLIRLNPLNKEIQWINSVLERVNELELNLKVVVITKLKRDYVEKNILNSGKLQRMNEIIYLGELSFKQRSEIFDKLKMENPTAELRYYIGDSFLSFDFNKIKEFTKKILTEPKEDYLDTEKEIEGYLISVDLDGVLNDISNYKYDLHEIQKDKLSKNVGSELDDISFVNSWLELSEDSKLEIKKESLKEYQKNEEIVQWIREYLDKISKKNKLVLFSVTSRKRIEYFLKSHKLSEYFERTYSSKDDFESNLKTKEMFEKIKSAHPEYKSFIHIGDLHELDFIQPKKAGFEAYLVDNSSYEKVRIEDLDL